MEAEPNDNQYSEPKWSTLSVVERRVAGVLVEKAKTTPDAYPLSLNALTNGCNQKSNRDPQMNLQNDDVEDVIDRLRQKGALGVVQGGGRVVKYRHYMKEWLGVDGDELAVMAELLLRGPQTIGELRGRAARMAPISDIGSLRPLVRALIVKNLLVELTVEGRGQIVTHGLYSEREMADLRRQYGSTPAMSSGPTSSAPPPRPAAPPIASQVASPPSDGPEFASSPRNADIPDRAAMEDLRAEVGQLRAELARLKQDVEDLWANVR